MNSTPSMNTARWLESGCDIEEVSLWGTSPLFNLFGFLGLAALGED
ncbi:hypothetical protein ES703_32851 [subsurface metagenome]